MNAFADRLRRTLATRAELGTLADAMTSRCRDLGGQRGDVIEIGLRHGGDALAAWAGAVLGGFVPMFVADRDVALGLGGARMSADIAIVQRTSGTTGTPQVLAIEGHRVLAQVDGLAAALGLRDNDVIASCLPLHHDMGLVSTVLLPLVCGTPCVHVDPALWRADAASLLHAIADARATLTWLPPSALARLVRRCADIHVDLSSLRQIVCGGEVVPDGLIRDFTTAFATRGIAEHVVGAGWGMAENVAAVTHSPPGRTPTRLAITRSSFAPGRAIEETRSVDALVLVSVGPPIAGTLVRVCDEGGNDLGERVLGELHVRGTCRADPDTWLPTGDVGLVADGEVYVCGRKDELLHTGGTWLPPHEVELAAGTVPGVRPGRIAALTDDRGTLVVLVEGDDAVDCDAIADAVARHTTHRPHVVLVAPNSLPRSTSGKLGRRRCATLVHSRSQPR